MISSITIMISKIRAYIIFSLFFTLIAACAGMQKYPGENSSIISSKPEILFVSILLEKNENEKIVIIDKQTKIVNGKIKTEHNNFSENSKEFILCSFLNNSNKTIKELKLENPLMRVVEYVDQTGKLGKTTIESAKEWLTFRTEYNKNIKLIRFELFSENRLTLIGQISL